MPEWYEDDNWFPSKWGAGDQLGTMNAITPSKVIQALKCVRRGKVYGLGHLMHNDMPVRTALHGPYAYFVSQRVYDHRPPLREPTANKFGAALGRVEMVDHAGTHLDSLNHISLDNKYYNGIDAFEVTTPRGTLKLGIETTPPVVTRGVMVDIPGVLGKDILEDGRGISVEEVEKFLKKENVEVSAGDAVFFYTGLSKLWQEAARYNEHWESSPGISYGLAKWLGERDVAVTGADTPASEVSPPEVKGTRLPVHQYLVTKCGIRLIDNMKLDELSKDKVYEFLFVCSPLPIKGATASPVAPVAIV